MGRIEWKVGVGTTFFSCCASSFNVLAGGARPLADARRVAGREWVILSPVREQPLGAWVETAWTGTWEKFEVPRERQMTSLQTPLAAEKRGQSR